MRPGTLKVFHSSTRMAFRNTTEYACALERPNRFEQRLARIVFLCAMALVATVLLYPLFH
jgi:hypothetical protein